MKEKRNQLKKIIFLIGIILIGNVIALQSDSDTSIDFTYSKPINYSLVPTVNDSTYWDGNAWSDTRWRLWDNHTFNGKVNVYSDTASQDIAVIGNGSEVGQHLVIGKASSTSLGNDLNSGIDSYGYITSDSGVWAGDYRMHSTLGFYTSTSNMLFKAGNNVGSTTNISFYTNNGGSVDEKARLTNLGDFAVGTTAPQSRMHFVESNDATFVANGNSDLIVEDTNNGYALLELSADSNNVGGLMVRHEGMTSGEVGGYLRYDNKIDEWTIWNQNALKMTILNSGNVGIGTRTPQNTLNVVGDLNVTGNTYLQDFTFNGDLDLSDGNITTTGNITANHGFFNEEVLITGAAVGLSADESANNLVIDDDGHNGISLINANDYRSNIWFGSPGGGSKAARIYYRYNDGEFVLGSFVANQDTVFYAGNSEHMRLDGQNDYTGINTTTPQNTLNVIGDANITGNLHLGNSNQPFLNFSDGTYSALLQMTDSGGARPGGLRLDTDRSASLYGLGIGMDPVYALDVSGTIRGDSYRAGSINSYNTYKDGKLSIEAGASPIISRQQADAQPILTIQQNNDTDGTGDLLQLNVTTTNKFRVDKDGNMTLVGNIIFALGEFIDNYVDGWLRVNGNLNVTGNITANNYYGGMFFHNDTGIEIELNDTFQIVPFTNSSNDNGFEFLESSKLHLIDDGGMYQVIYRTSGYGTQNHVYHSTIFINENKQENTESHAVGQASTFITTYGMGFVRISNGDNVTLRMRDEGDTTTGTAIAGNVNLVRVGN